MPVQEVVALAREFFDCRRNPLRSLSVRQFKRPGTMAMSSRWRKITPRAFNINVKGVLFSVQKALPLMPDGGSVILTASVASIKGLEATSVYSATKAAVRSFARTWTADLKARKIRVNVISPGPIETPMMDHLGGTAEGTRGLKVGMAALVPLGRLGQPD